jgi:hypothetical protein
MVDKRWLEDFQVVFANGGEPAAMPRALLCRLDGLAEDGFEPARQGTAGPAADARDQDAGHRERRDG